MSYTRALKWTQPLDPKELLDYGIDLTGRLLDSGETIASWTLTPSDASIAAGLIVGSGQYAPTEPTTTSLQWWFSIDPSRQEDAAFDGVGVFMDMVLAVTTSNDPLRKRERTLLLQVCRQ